MEQLDLESRGFGPENAGGDWNINLGAGVGVAPNYPGASSNRVRAIPFAFVSYKNEFFLSPAGLGWNAIHQDGFRAGPLLGLMGGRHESDDAHLTGLGNIAPSAAVGAFATYRTGIFRVSGSVRQAITHTSNGLEGQVQADVLVPLNGKDLLLAVGPELAFASANYNQTFFGVNAQQAVQSGLPAYNAGAGLRDVGLHADLSYLYSPHLIFRGFVNVKELTGNDANSPLVQNKRQTTVGAGAAWHF